VNRPKYQQRIILLTSDLSIESAIQVLRNAPRDQINPLEFVLREKVKLRKPTQNDLMWAGPLKDIEEQGWLAGQSFHAKVWHEYFKELFLPEQAEEGITKEGYVKWGLNPKGERIVIGSTTDLTTGGFSIYLEKLYAYGANELNVKFSANPREYA